MAFDSMRVAVGMSGGVDSSVAAALLKEEGHDVIGVFMKNWDERDENGVCTAEADFSDVRRVCEHLDIPYYAVNFSKEYWERVFTLFLNEYAAGRTPNPDVLCNREIKFNAFLDFALKLEADSLATGHYARLSREGRTLRLLKGADQNKDQTYFLCMLTARQLDRALFPVGGMQKAKVREYARRRGIPTAEKKDSTGICFIGERKFREFLMRYLPAKPGEIRSCVGELVGAHQGLMYYTLGQRRGLGIGGGGDGRRWFVVGKDLRQNVLIVAQGEDHPLLYSAGCVVTGLNFIQEGMPGQFCCTAKLRYRQADHPVRVTLDDTGATVCFETPQRAVTPGQYAAFYQGDCCLGGGVIDRLIKG